MTNLYKFMADDLVEDMAELENYANQLKINKRLLVKGLYHREFYNGEYFNWAGPCLELYSTKDTDLCIYLCVRVDFLDINTVASRFSNDIFCSTVAEFSFRSAKYLVLKLSTDFRYFTRVHLKTQEVPDNLARALSIPIYRILLSPKNIELNKEEIEFALFTGSVSPDFDVYPLESCADKTSEYFIEVCKELTNES